MPARVSYYRPNGTSRRAGGRHITEHDPFEGLPVRQWNRTWVPIVKKTLGPPPPPEMPLPKETHLLNPTSQMMLQAARSATMDKNNFAIRTAAKPDQVLYTVRKWVATPKGVPSNDGEPAVDKQVLGNIPDIVRKRRRVKKRIDGKIVVSYVDEHLDVGHAVPTAAPPQPPVPRRRPPPKRKPARGRRPGMGRKPKAVEEANAAAAAAAGQVVDLVGGGEASVTPATGAAVASGESQVKIEEGTPAVDAAPAAPAASAAPEAPASVVQDEGTITKVAEIGQGEVEMMDLDQATVDDGHTRNEIAQEVEKREVEEEEKALENLAKS